MTEEYDLKQRLDKAEWVLNNTGFRRCDIAACNCGSWHQVGGFKARFDEIKEAVEEADYSTNGKLLLDVVKGIIADAKRSGAPQSLYPVSAQWSCGTCSDKDVPEKFRVFGSCYKCAAQRSIAKRDRKIEALRESNRTFADHAIHGAAQAAPEHLLTDDVINLSLSEFFDISPRNTFGDRSRVAMRKAILTALSALSSTQPRTPPTIDDLEAILNSNDDRQVTINPDGTVTVSSTEGKP